MTKDLYFYRPVKPALTELKIPSQNLQDSGYKLKPTGDVGVKSSRKRTLSIIADQTERNNPHLSTFISAVHTAFNKLVSFWWVHFIKPI